MKRDKLSIVVSEDRYRAATSEFERDPLPCPRCECGLMIRELRAGLIEALCGCCAARWLVEVVR